MSAISVPSKHLHIARVLSEDNDFVTVEIPKSLDQKLTLGENDRFFTLLFVHNTLQGMVTWIPWEDA